MHTEKCLSQFLFCFNNKVVYIEILSLYLPLTRKLEGQRKIQEEYKKNNEHTSDNKEVHEGMINRKVLAGGEQ